MIEHIRRAADLVAELDRTADAPNVNLLPLLAREIASVVAARHGTGTWAASHALRQLTDDDVALLLTAYGATTFTIGQHTEEIRSLIRGRSFTGGA